MAIWARVHPLTLDYLLKLKEENLGRAIDRLVEDFKNIGRRQAAGDSEYPSR